MFYCLENYGIEILYIDKYYIDEKYKYKNSLYTVIYF